MVRRALGLIAMIIAAILVSGAPAQAEDGIPLVGDLPMAAKTACTDRAPGPYADLDLWRFALTEGDSRFVSLSLGFRGQNGATSNRTVDASGIDGAQAWIAVDPGSTLERGSATVEGGATAFEVVRVCAAGAVAVPAPIAFNAVRAQPHAGPRALASGTDIGPTVTLGSTLVVAGVLLLIVRRRPRGRHRARG